MLKLISLNMETNKHYAKIIPFIDQENPDVLCLQEAPESFAEELQKLGFETFFAPMFLLDDLAGEDISAVGVMFASKLPCKTHVKYYYSPSIGKIVLYDTSNRSETRSYTYIFAKIDTPNGKFNIATTHPLKSVDGRADDFQKKLFTSLLNLLAQEEPHIICGDFNMPRGYNTLYEEVTKKYIDTVPLAYKSSLDRNIHRLGRVALDEPIFDEYMVDYIFTQPPYRAENVRLEFGVSDHAAVVANIFKTTD